MSTIRDLREKIKGLRYSCNIRAIQDDVFLGLIIILVAFGSFGLGRLSKIEDTKMPIQIENSPEVTSETFTQEIIVKNESGQAASLLNSVETKTSELVGSKNGTKYHYAWCSGAQRIAEANKIYFTSKADAEARGYTPASNCKGL